MVTSALRIASLRAHLQAGCGGGRGQCVKTWLAALGSLTLLGHTVTHGRHHWSPPYCQLPRGSLLRIIWVVHVGWGALYARARP